jgi:hypothetical protein
MRRSTTVVLLVLLAGLIYGCQPPAATEPGSESSAPSAPTSNTTAGATPSEESLRPAQLSHRQLAVNTVTTFLTALKNGDHSTATAMLSEKAQTETAKQNLGISPPGSTSAQFVVDPEGVFKGQDGNTYVLSSWTDTDSRGVTQTYDIGWILKNEKDSLAITGMVTKVFDDGDELLLNFEDPVDMMRRRNEAEAEIARRHQQIQNQQNVARDPNGQPIIR